MKVLIALSFAAAAIAQTDSGIVFSGAIGPAPAYQAVHSGAWTSTISFAGLHGGTVTGAPYSAEQVTEHVQTLADGTRITQPSNKVRIYRDSQGRTRTETWFLLPHGASAAGGEAPNLIEIFDPSAGARYTLEPGNHVARKISFPAAPPPPPNSATAAPTRVARILPAPAPDDQTPHPQFSRDSLGTQTIEGVLAEGSRMTVTYPIGAVGNDRPIATVSETWMSPELKMVILSKNSDPRSGESTTRLTNISRSEPDASLFQIPAGYEIIDPQAVPKQ